MLFQSLHPHTHSAIHGVADVSKFLSFQVTDTKGPVFKSVPLVSENRWQ